MSEGVLLTPQIGKVASPLDFDSGLWPVEKWPLCAWNEVSCSHFSQQNGGHDKATKTTHRRGEGARKWRGCRGRSLNIVGLKLQTQACVPPFINKGTVFISKCLISGQQAPL